MINVNKLPGILRKDGIEKQLVKICEQNDVVLLAIFGSFVRGEQKKRSDIDITIEFDRDARKTLLDLVHLERELKRIFKRNVDLGIFSSLSPHVSDRVKKEMKIIYEKR